MPLEKINVEEMVCAGYGGSPTPYLKILANKINEIIDVLNEKKDEDCDHGKDMCCGKCTWLTYKSSKNDWEKEFDKIFGGGVYEYVNNGLYNSIKNEVKYFIRNLLK